jgi:hypothetical protein
MPFLFKSNFHRKGTTEPLFSLAVPLNGKRKGSAVRNDQVDLKAVSFSFPLRERKAKKNSLCVLCVSGVTQF